MISNLTEYIQNQNTQAQEWLNCFFDYVSKNYSDKKITMFRQCPMYKKTNNYLDGYLMFTAAKEHITLHTLDLDLIEEMKVKLPKAQFGKGCIKVKFKNREYIPLLYEFCDKVLKRF